MTPQCTKRINEPTAVRRRLLIAFGAVLFALPRLGAQVWDGGAATGNWATAGNWNPNAVPGTGANVSFDSGNANGQFVITLQNTSRTVGSMTFLSAGGAQGFTFNAGTATLTIGAGGIVNNDDALQIFNAPVAISASQTWNAGGGGLAFANVSLGGNLTLAGVGPISVGGTTTLTGTRTLTNGSAGTVTLAGITGTNRNLTIAGSGDTVVTGPITTGTGSLTKNGSGALVLSGANTYTGGTYIGTSGGAAGGTLRLGASNVLPASAVTVYGGTLDLNNFNDAIGALNLGRGAAGTAAVVNTGTGTLTLGGTVTYTATNNPNGAVISGNLALGANRTVTVGDSTATAADLTIDAAVSGSYNLTKTGAGTLVLSGANTYAGTTAVSAGVLEIRSDSALGAAGNTTTVANGSALQLQGGINVTGETLTLSGTGVGNLGALRNVSGNNTWAGSVGLAANSQIQSDAGVLTIGGAVLRSGGTNRALTVAGAGDVTISGVINNTISSVTKTGTGTLLLSGVNTYTGATTVSAGTLRAGVDNALSNNTAVTVAAGATFDLNGYVDTIGSLAGGGIVTLGGGTLTAGANNTSTTFSGTISGTGGIAKTGTGTLVLSGANTYTGDTTISAGAVTLGASENMAGRLVLNGGELVLGGFSGTFASLSVTGNSILDFGTGSGSVLKILGSVTIDSAAILTIQNWNDTVDYFYSLIDPGMTDPSIFNRIVFQGFSGPPKWQSFDSEITPVPEPSVYGAALLLLTGLAVAWRRRRLN